MAQLQEGREAQEGDVFCVVNGKPTATPFDVATAQKVSEMAARSFTDEVMADSTIFEVQVLRVRRLTMDRRARVLCNGTPVAWAKAEDNILTRGQVRVTIDPEAFEATGDEAMGVFTKDGKEITGDGSTIKKDEKDGD